MTLDHGWEAVPETARTPRWIARLAFLLLLALIALPVVLVFAPWQQTVRGSGRVIAYAPLDRQQSVESPISGRVVSWYVQEGTSVAEGDPLFEIADIDPFRLERLGSQRDALEAKLASFESQVQQYQFGVENIRSVGALTVRATAAKLDETAEKVAAAEADLDGANASLVAARNQVERKRRLSDSGTGAISARQLELAEAEFGIANSKVENAIAKLDAAKADYRSVQRELERASVDADSKVNSATALLEEARSKVADTNQKIAEIEGELSRQQSQLVTSPRNGVVHRLSGNQGGEIVKAGDPLLVLVPETDQRSVELLIDGNDAPLVTLGAPVRLQFEGWPAVQFAGWPSVAVGTFGGKIALLDPTDNGQGQFRVLVLPNEDEDWPGATYLRQGVRAKAWVLLNEVPIGMELWRQLNGFPPVIAEEEPTGVARKRLK